jgi:serine/threonine protein kinase
MEKTYRRWTTTWHEDECIAYYRLRSLQGSCIPKFYGSMEFDESASMPPFIDLEVHGILIEFIDGITLEDVDSKSLKCPHVGEAVILCLEKIFPFGILHGDVRPANVMVRLDGHIFLIDFAYAKIRRDDETDEGWCEYASSRNEVQVMKNILHMKKIRNRTPPAPYSNGDDGYWSFNEVIEAERESWRAKYYEPITFDSDTEDDVDITTSPGFLFLWRLKEEEVMARRNKLNDGRSAIQLEIHSANGWGSRHCGSGTLGSRV